MNSAYNENATFIGLKRNVALEYITSTMVMACPEYELNVFDCEEHSLQNSQDVPIFERSVDSVRDIENARISVEKSELEKALADLDSLVSLERGWDGYDAEPVSRVSVDLTRKVLRAMDVVKGLVVGWDVSPTGRSTVQIEKTTVMGYFEVEFFGDGRMSCYAERDGRGNRCDLFCINDVIKWVNNVVS